MLLRPTPAKYEWLAYGVLGGGGVGGIALSVTILVDMARVEWYVMFGVTIEKALQDSAGTA